MTVPEPLEDEMFSIPDAQLARMYDVTYTQLVADAMRCYSISKPKAEKLINKNETKVRADCMRYNE